MAAAKRILCYAKGLMAECDNVDIVISRKCFNEDDISFPKKGIYQDIPYNYIRGKYKNKNKLIQKLDWYLFDILYGFLYALKNVKKGDVVYFYFYNNLFEFLLLQVCKLKGAKSVREVCEHPLALGRSTLWHRICCWCEFNFLFPLFDAFIPISRELDKFICKYKKKKAQHLIVPILVKDDVIKFDVSKYLNQYDVPYIIHTGTMLEKKDSISKILEAFAIYKKDNKNNCRLVFTGPQANESCSYIPMMEKLNIRAYVDLLGIVSMEKVAVLQYYAALTIIYKSDNLQTRNCFPTKLGEMLLSGVPVITTTIGDANLYLKDGESAFIIEENDQKALVTRMKQLLSDSELNNKIGKAGRNVAIKEFDYIYQGKRLSKFIHGLFVKD